MFTLEVLDVDGFWEMIPDIFDSADDAELYYRRQLSGFVDFRITEEVL